jgi:hypothetical protein
MADPTEESKHEVEPENVNGSVQPAPEASVKDAATITVPVENAPKVGCKKHPDAKSDKKKKRSKKKHDASESSSDSSGSTDSSSESDSGNADSESIASESESDKRRRHRLKTKVRAKRSQKDKKRRRKRKVRSRRSNATDSDTDTDDSDTDSESSRDTDSSLDEKALRKLVTRLKLKKRAKRLRDETNDDLGVNDPLGETRRDKRSKKKRPASKVAFKRVDQRE